MRDSFPVPARSVVRLHCAALAAYAVLAIAFTWPLAIRLTTHLTGDPAGDTGVYVWNTWVFRHELVEHGRLPFLTREIFSLTQPADLTLHNYTTFANLLALPLQPWLGVVGTFNLVYVTLVVLTAWCTFLLARRVTKRTTESWLCGAMFAFSAPMVARSTAHFSLVAAAPLPVFLLMLMRTDKTRRPRDAALLGLIVAWAAFCDVYYAIYCLLIGASYAAWRMLHIEWSGARGAIHSNLLLLFDLLSISLAGLVIGLALRGGGRLDFFGLRLSMHSLYTPTLLLTLFGLIRLALWLRPIVRVTERIPLGTGLQLSGAAAFAAIVPLSPVIVGIVQRMLDGRFVNPPIFWRSSPPGVDALAFLMPNPMNAMFGEPWRLWLATRPNDVVENVAAISLVGVAIVAIAVWKGRVRLPGLWVGLTLLFGMLALGPFVHVAGFNTFIPTPWALLRYVPLVGSARTPARFAIVAVLAFCTLAAVALTELGKRYPARRRLLLSATSLALLFELWPAPRVLHSAHIPTLHQRIAADARDVRVLTLPVGVRDGTSSTGNHSALSQFYQTAHGKRLVGGYLSRVSARRIKDHRKMPVMDALLTLSEGRALTPEQAERAWANRDRFLKRAELGYVVINRQRASPELRRFAIDLLRLERIGEEAPRELYVPRR
jgi:hypothetical protein